MNDSDLKKPSLETDRTVQQKGALIYRNGDFFFYANHMEYVEFRFALWLQATSIEYYDDISPGTHGLEHLSLDGLEIYYSEITLVRDEDALKRKRAHQENYDLQVDEPLEILQQKEPTNVAMFYITRNEARNGFLAIEELDRNYDETPSGMVKVFDHFWMQIIREENI